MQFDFPGWLRERKSKCCLHRPGASLEGLWESPACLPQFSTLTAAEHFQCAQHTVQTPSHSTLSPPHAFFAEITTTHNSKKLQKDTHYSREPSLVFLKYMTLDIRFHFSSHFAIPSLKCIPICAFFSEHQACKLLFQAKKSLKEVTPQRKGSAHFLRGSYYIEYPWEMKYSHLVSHFFGTEVAHWVRWSTKGMHWKKERPMVFVPHICLSQPELLSTLWGSNSDSCYESWWLCSAFGTLHTHRGTQLWTAFFLPLNNAEIIFF